MTHDFDLATAVQPLAEGRYGAQLDGRWEVGDGLLNGGYLMALGANAGLDGSVHRHPVAVSATFLRPIPAGPAVLDVVALRSGRTVRSSRVSLYAEGQPVAVELQVTAATLGDSAVPEWTDATAPPIAPPERCLPISAAGTGRPPPGLASVLDYAFDPATSGWLTGRPGQQPLLNLWLRFADGRDMDPLGLVLLGDAPPPVSFAVGRFGWAPTIAMQTLVRAVPAPGWCQAQARARLVGGGFSDEEVAIWDSTGALVAQSRQLAVPPRPVTTACLP